MIKKCLVCNNEFLTYPSKIKLGRGKYCSKTCSNSITLIKKGQRLSPATELKGTLNPKGYRITVSRENGRPYRELFLPEYPNTMKNGYIREHRYIMEQHLGRPLEKDEIVHHIDGDTLNNNPSNLEVMLKKDHDRMNTYLNIHKRWLKRGDATPHANYN